MALSELGECLVKMEQYEEAEQRLLDGYRVQKETRIEGDLHRIASVRRLVEFYTTVGKTEAAERWQDELDQLNSPQKK